jgi:hypothetical protein
VTSFIYSFVLSTGPVPHHALICNQCNVDANQNHAASLEINDPAMNRFRVEPSSQKL